MKFKPFISVQVMNWISRKDIYILYLLLFSSNVPSNNNLMCEICWRKGENNYEAEGLDWN